MELYINDIQKAATFVKILKNMNLLAECVSIMFYKDKLYIQGIENSKSSVFEVILAETWFTNYSIEAETEITMSCNILAKVFSIHSDKESIKIGIHDEDFMNIEFRSEGDFKKDLSIPLMDNVCSRLEIKPIDYDVEFIMLSKTLSTVVDKLNVFGNTLNIVCSDELIEFKCNDIDGELKCILYDNNDDKDFVDEYSCVENLNLNVSYSMKLFVHFCSFEKANENVLVYFSEDKPMKMTYKLDDDLSELNFYLAPKIDDDN